MELDNKLMEQPVPKCATKRLWESVLQVALFIVLMLAINVLALIPFYAVCPAAYGEDVVNNIPLLIVQEAIMLLSVLVAACIVFRIRHLSFGHLGLSFRRKSFVRGTLFALAFYVLGFGLSLLLGVVEISGVSFQPGFLSSTFLFFLLVSITEEVAMRGFILRHLLDGGVSKFWALLLSSIIFSLMHLFNPNFTFLPFLNLILAGFMLGASYVYTRNLSFPIALHLMWNWLQGPVLGYEVSGNKFGESLLSLRLTEAHLVNGGSFGFEGSIICTALMLAAIVFLLRIPSVSKP